MAVSLTSPVTGAAQTGFTSPTYTLTVDTPPGVNSKQWAITALGGTQTGVDAHTVSKPFTTSFFRPASLKTLPAANPVTGIIKGVGYNVYKLLTRKGMLPAANQTPLVGSVETRIVIPAGADTYEPEEIRAMLSAHIGALSQVSAGLGDTAINGVV